MNATAADTPSAFQTDVRSGSVTRLVDEGFGDGVFEPIRTGIPEIDRMMSSENGITRGSMMLTFGDPGAGKSTVMLKVLVELQRRGYDVLFVSAEMNKLDVAWMARRFPEYAEIPVWYVDFRTEDPLGKFIDHLSDGYDFVVVDSLATFSEFASMDDSTSLSKKRAQQKMISACASAMEGVDASDGTVHTSFSLIQQVNKSGNFAGSKMLEHMVTACLEFRVEGDTRYLKFGKNRRGGMDHKLYFSFEDGLTFGDSQAETAADGGDDGNADAPETLTDAPPAPDEGGNDTPPPADSEGYRHRADVPVTLDEVSHVALDGVLDKDVVSAYIDNNGPLQDAYKELQADGHVPESASRYFFVCFVNRYQLADRVYAA